MRIREPDAPERRLTNPQRATLRSRISAVPRGAARDHPSILALISYVQSLQIPWWVHEASAGTVYLRFGDPDQLPAALGFLAGLRTLDDWGTEPPAPHSGPHDENGGAP